MAQNRGAIAQGSGTGEVSRHGVEASHLLCNTSRTVRVAKVGHQRDFIDLCQGIEPRPRRTKGIGREPEAVHPRVELQKYAVCHLRLVGCKPVNLFITVHGMPQI